jgi:hypothetical protein
VPDWLADVFALLLRLLPGALWCAWWLWGVNWKKAWPVLAQGAWAPVLLLMILSALVWSRISPSSRDCFGLFTIPNFWWHLGGVGALTAVALFCGWLQGKLGWAPVDINLEPPPHGHGLGHGHPHGHH